MTRRREFFRVHAVKRTYNKATGTFTFNISYQTTPAQRTPRTQTVAEAFGLGNDQTQQFTLYDNTNIHIRPTDIVLITGESGSGKSALLKALKTDLGSQAADTKTHPTNPDAPIIETLGETTSQALNLLCKAGLNDAFLFLRTYSQLSDGQKHRYHIAKLAETQAQWWILDEFTSTLDRDTAKIVAYNLQRTARTQGKAVIAATTHNDIKTDLAPNVHIHKHYGKQLTITYHPKAHIQQCTLTKKTTTQPGTLQDYKALSNFHYRTAHATAPRKIFTLKRKNELIGTIIYTHPPPFCFGRSKAWKGNLQQLQREVSLISRVVIHPKYRGIGLGEKLVRETLPQCGTPCVEAVAVMAKINPFFEHAGMQPIAESHPSKPVAQTLQTLEELGFEPALLPNVAYVENRINQVGAQKITALLLQLSQKDGAARKRLATARNPFPKHEEVAAKIQNQTPSQLAQTLKRLSFLAQSKLYLFWRKPEETLN